nr:immunoglobulin heavy chain junction region [Mus musculus]MBK4195522.1 immunoglobulin heavy chain junction region [Mus musculus]
CARYDYYGSSYYFDYW